MHRYKKIILGLVLVVGLFAFFSSRPHHVTAAATYPNDYYGSCVDTIISNTGGTLCTSFSGTSNSNLYYLGFGPSYMSTVLFQAPYSATGYSSPPSSFLALDPTTLQPIVANSAAQSRFAYTGPGQNFNTQRNGTTVYVYKPTDQSIGNYVLLVGVKNDGSLPRIFALVNNTKQTDPTGGSDGTVYAYSVNTDAIASTPTGAPIPPTGSGSGTGTGAGTTTPKSCRENFDSSFEWLLCPALEQADDVASKLNNFVEGQLCFKTGNTSSTGGVVCSGKNLLDDTGQTNGPKRAWSVFRYIATGLLVIIMLVLVISQAASIGPFDAYTLRKVLPRLVAAVILIQISWVMLKWFIDLSNDLGQGIQALIYAPFGGADSLSFDKVLGTQLKAAVGPGAGATAFTLFSAVAAIGATIANLPGLLLLALFVVISLFVAFFVLLLRKILIILLVLLAPIALVAWILPGTERYWKSWSNNFIKLLAMFPLIMGIIAAGHVFAALTVGVANIFPPHLAWAHLGGVPVPYLASVSDFAGLVIVIFAFFGPYFLLPQTFKWGGQLLGVAAGAVAASRMTRGMQEKSKGVTDELGKRYRGNLANRYELTGKGPGQAFKRGVLRTLSGHPVPFRRQTLAVMREGAQYKQELVEGEQYRISSGYKEVLARTGSVKEGKKWAVEQAGSDDAYRRRAAYNFLIDSSSWLEMDDPDIRKISKGKDKGKDIFKTQEWIDTLHASPERIAKVAATRPDWMPFELPLGGGPVDDDQRMSNVLQKMGTADLAKVHPTFFKEINRLSEDGHNQAAKDLGGLLEKAKNMGSTGQFQIGPLLGGERSAQQPIDETMSRIGRRDLRLESIFTPGGGGAAPGGGGGPSAGPGPAGARPRPSPDSGGGARFAANASGVRDTAPPPTSSAAPGATVPTPTETGGVPFDSDAFRGAVASGMREALRTQDIGAAPPTEVTITPPPPTRIETDRGVLEIRHDPTKEVISPGGVIQPPTSRPSIREQSSEEEDNIRNRTFGGGQPKPPGDES